MSTTHLSWDAVLEAAEERIFIQEDGEPYRNDLTMVRNLKAVREQGANEIYRVEMTPHQLAHAVLPYHHHGEDLALSPEGGSYVEEAVRRLIQAGTEFPKKAPNCAATFHRLEQQLHDDGHLGIGIFTSVAPREFKSYDFAERFDNELYNIDGFHRSMLAHIYGGPDQFSETIVACRSLGELEGILAKHR